MQNMKKILIIDDDMDICHLLKRLLSKNGYEVATAHNGVNGIAALSIGNPPDLVMTDFRLGDMEGIEILSHIKSRLPQVPVLVITGYSDIRIAVNVMKLGAYDYITKPLFPQEILLTIQKALKSVEENGAMFSETNDSTNGSVNDFTTDSAADLNNNSTPKDPSVFTAISTETKGKTRKNASKNTLLGYIVGTSAAATELVRQIDLVAPTNYSVIVYGESGSGKEAVARLIHARSPRCNAPFVAMDCGAIPKELASSELFGHEKGAFTGANTVKIGHFEAADGGTIFLDEVANLPYDVQVSLLRVVQERRFRRVGGSKEMPIDIRFVVASNERLSEAVQRGKFREDLYHRFNEFSIDAPPLRERRADIMQFASQFLAETSADLGKKMLGFEPEVIAIFKEYPWFGNVRELKNVIKRAALLSDGDYIVATALPFEIVNHAKLAFVENDILPVASLVETETPKNGTPQYFVEKPPVKPPMNLKIAAEEAEYEAIVQVLKTVKFNKSKAADQLGIDRKTLYNKLKKYGIE